MHNRPWSEPELLLLEAGVGAGLSNAEILTRLEGEGYTDRTWQAVSQKRRATGLPNETQQRYTRIVSDRQNFTVATAAVDYEEPVDEILEAAIRKTNWALEREVNLPYAHVKLITSKPIGVCFVSDQHISTDGPVDLERMFIDAQLIQETQGLYCVLGGDGIDGHLKHRRALLNSATKPSDQWALYNKYLSVLGLKTLAMLAGNHESWTEAFAGIDMVFELAKRHKIHYSKDETVLTLELTPTATGEGQKYVAKMRHKYKYGSSFNLGHTVKRMYDMAADPFDIGVVCHHHEASMEVFNKHGLPRIAFRPGSYQVSSDYASAEGFNRAYPTCPTVVLFPDERRIIPFHDMRDAIEYLGAIRG